MTRVRRRNSVLAALERLRAGGEQLNLTEVLAYLYVCENEGLSVSELALLLRTTTATASRTVASLAEAASAGGLELIASRTNEKHAQGRILVLSPRGRRMAEEIDQLIDQAVPIGRAEAASGLQ